VPQCSIAGDANVLMAYTSYLGVTPSGERRRKRFGKHDVQGTVICNYSMLVMGSYTIHVCAPFVLNKYFYILSSTAVLCDSLLLFIVRLIAA